MTNERLTRWREASAAADEETADEETADEETNQKAPHRSLDGEWWHQ